MIAKFAKKTRGNASYFLGRGFYWLAVAMLIPVLLAFYQTTTTAKQTIVSEAERVAVFFISEIDQILGATERTMDTYLRETGGSCATTDLIALQKYMVSSGDVRAMGIVAADGNVSCSVGENSLDNYKFAEATQNNLRHPQLAELNRGNGALPLLIKQNREGLRIFALVSKTRFTRLLLPGVFNEHAQIDIVMPDGGLWYSVTGHAVTNGFEGGVLQIERISNRFPIALSLVVDEKAVSKWSGALHASLIVVMLLCLTALVFVVFANILRIRMKKRRERRQRERSLEKAQSLFSITYQPLLNLENNLLMGAIARFDLSIFDGLNDEKPELSEIFGLIWAEIGEFAEQRRVFHLVIEVEGEMLVNPDVRNDIIERLKAIDYPNLSLLIRWPREMGFDSDLYRPLEQIATAGCQLAIECSTVRFSLLSDMWTWPYHQLFVDFSEVPDSEEAIFWMADIIMNMSEQLQIDAVAMGLLSRNAIDNALGNGFELGAGNYLGPDLTIEALMAAVRPVGQPETEQESEADGKAEDVAKVA